MRFVCLSLSALALAVLGGCSDPPPPTAKGGFTVSFADTGAGCNIASHTDRMGDVSDKTKFLLTDGVDGVDIACTVSGSSAFSIDASFTKDADSLTIIVNNLANTATKDKPTTGQMSFSDAKTAGEPFSTGMMPCDFYFVPGAGQKVAAGQVWLAFQCPDVVLENQSCSIAESFAAFENCLK